MKIVFFGYRKWAAEILKNLQGENSTELDIVGLVTTKNAEGNFPNSLQIDPKKMNDPKVLEQIKALNPEILLFYGWSWIIPKELYEGYVSLVLHPSPLPKYRGGSPLQHQIINGEQHSAVTLFKVSEKMDGGPIYSQSGFSLDGTIQQILDRIVEIGTRDTIQVVHKLTNHSISPTEQNESEATSFKRRTPEESELTIKDFEERTAEELYNFIRALSDPYPNAYVRDKDEKKLFLKQTDIEHE